MCLILLQKIIKLFENVLNINITQYHSFYSELTTIRTESPRGGKESFTAAVTLWSLRNRLLEVIFNGTAWRKISLRDMWDRNSMYKG